MLSGQILTYKEWEGRVRYEIPAILMRGGGRGVKHLSQQGGGLELFQVNNSVSS